MPKRSARRGTAGLTLVELMIVVMIIGLIGSVALPNLLAARIRNNETAAVSTLRTMHTSQTQFREGVRADVDADGIGEFGLLRELSGVAPVRTTETGTSTGVPLEHALLANTFGALTTEGEVVRAGYHFKVFLPGESGKALAERSLTQLESSGPQAIDSDLSETAWCAYAWPAEADVSGEHTFFVNQAGAVTRAENDAHGNHGAHGIGVAEAGSALSYGGDRAVVLGSAAIDAAGRDGRTWQRVR